MVDLQDNLEAIHNLNAEVIGVSNSLNVALMAERFALTFPMLTDSNASVCQSYEAFTVAGRVEPTTVVINKNGVIHSKYREQLSDSLPVLEDLQTIEGIP